MSFVISRTFWSRRLAGELQPRQIPRFGPMSIIIASHAMNCFIAAESSSASPTPIQRQRASSSSIFRADRIWSWMPVLCDRASFPLRTRFKWDVGPCRERAALPYRGDSPMSCLLLDGTRHISFKAVPARLLRPRRSWRFFHRRTVRTLASPALPTRQSSVRLSLPQFSRTLSCGLTILSPTASSNMAIRKVTRCSRNIEGALLTPEEIDSLASR